MAVPTYEELLAHCYVDGSLMEQTFSDDHLMKLATSLDSCEMLAMSLGIPDADIKGIMSQGDVGVQRIRLLKCWKQRCGSMATYKALVKTLLQINRTDLAEKVVALQQPSRENTQNSSRHSEINQATPMSPVSSNGTQDTALSAATVKDKQTQQMVKQTLRELEEEFLELVIYIENTLESNQIKVNEIVRRFSMLPQSVKRHHETDKNYNKVRRMILNSKTVKQLFDNLTELKHWNYMMPEMLAHILKGVKIDELLKKIDEYKEKILAFKANTKLRNLIGISFPVPEHCIELTMKVEGWEDKTIEEAENCTINIIQPATNGGQTAHLGWKAVNPGCITLTFILIESVQVDKQKLFETCKDRVKVIKIDGNYMYNDGYAESKVRCIMYTLQKNG